VEHSPERELKLAATQDFHMPSIYGLVGSIVRQAPPERNETTYYDTPDLRLARWGASLRHRPGEGWTVKLPAERDAPFLVRPEIVFDGDGDSPPAGAVELVRGFIRHSELRESVHMTTIRRRTAMHDADGQLIAGVVDDAVSVRNGNGPSTFRELEVEIGDELTPDVLDALVERLRQAGAGAPNQTAKYIRALAPAAPLTPEIAVADIGADATAGDVVRRAVALSVIRLIRHDSVVRLDVDPEGVHQARVATRRLRSDLRTFRPLVDEAWAATLRDELGWIAGLLGAVRDGDVLLERMRSSASALEVADAAAPVLGSLQASRDAALVVVLDALRSDRYASLLERLVDAANDPALTPRAAEAANEAIPALVGHPWRALKKQAKTLDAAPTDDHLHALRIRTKRVRYAAEAAAPIVGKPARAFAHAAARLQDVLGDLNDAVVAGAWLEARASDERDAAASGAARALAAAERSAAQELRATWRAVWGELADPRLRAWM
jgi:CHAD domain-containing protein